MARVVAEFGIPQHVHVEVVRLASGFLLEIAGKPRPMTLRHLNCGLRILIIWCCRIGFPNCGMDLVTAHLAGSADFTVVVSGFNHSQGVQAFWIKGWLGIRGPGSGPQDIRADRRGVGDRLRHPDPNAEKKRCDSPPGMDCPSAVSRIDT